LYQKSKKVIPHHHTQFHEMLRRLGMLQLSDAGCNESTHRDCIRRVYKAIWHSGNPRADNVRMFDWLMNEATWSEVHALCPEVSPERQTRSKPTDGRASLQQHLPQAYIPQIARPVSCSQNIPTP